MALREKIDEDLKNSLKEKKEIEVSVLRMLKAAILNKEKEKRYKLVQETPGLNLEELNKESQLAKDFETKSQLTDEEMVNLIFSEIKKRKESIVEFEKGKREDLVQREKAEAELLQKYLPEQISQEEVRKITKEIIEKIGAKDQKDIGKVMAELMPKVKGKCEGSLVSKIVKELLS